MHLKRIIQNVELIYIVKVKEVEKDKYEEKIFQPYPLLQEFKDVFLVYFPRLPSKIEFDFSIDLIPGVEPISKSHYRMTINEIQELKVQL